MVVLKEMRRSKRNGILSIWWGGVLIFLLSGCGGGGGSTSVNAVVPTTSASHAQAANAFTITGDEYGMQNATYVAATTSSQGVALRAAIASSLTDPDFRTTVRVDINNPSQISAPGVYSLGSTAGVPFPGTVYFFDGHPSTLLQTVAGTITFTAFGTNEGDPIVGSFAATVKDGNDSAGSTYTIRAEFSFTAGGSGPLTTTTAPIPAIAGAAYDANCASCHSLGSYDATTTGGPNLALKGGKLTAVLPPDTAGHQGIRLAAAQVKALQILLNAN